jgi:hypothetical protein
LHHLHTLLEIDLCPLNKHLPGSQLLLPGAIKGQQLLEQLLLFRSAVAGAWLVDKLEPSGDKNLLVDDVLLGWRSGACRPGEVDEDTLASLDLFAWRRVVRG